MIVHTLGQEELALLLDQLCRCRSELDYPRLGQVFEEILKVAYEFVPSESGSITLGDGDQLVFIASFGVQAGKLVGTRMPAASGITGEVYRKGVACINNDVQRDTRFYSAIDEMTGNVTKSILSVPIIVCDHVVGVMSLVNRKGDLQFQNKDLNLMRIFSGYIGTSILNLFEARVQAERACRDHLTGLFNDRYFFQRLLEEIERCESSGEDLGLIFLDLDHFKGVVDRYGHLIGSRVLTEVGSVIAETVTEERAVLARYGGDEFVVILPGMGEQEILAVAERLRQAVAEAVFIKEPQPDGTPPLHLSGMFTASIGVASYKRSRPSGENVAARRNRFIRLADQAMYAAKRLGKNRVVSWSTLRAGI